ncbi:MAG: ABC transporter permease subunit [Clostridia bacterium]|nr:ABC transporter permease subunit [Clostridia bacterium]
MLKNKKAREGIAFLLGIVLILILIEAGSALKGDRLVFPTAGEISRAFVRLISSGGTWARIGTTLLHIIEALAISVLIGTGLGIAEGLIPFLHALLRPLMSLLRSLPMILLVIIIMVIAPYSMVPVLTAGMVLIPMISEAGYEGVVRMDPELIDVYRMNSGLNLTILARVYLPMMSGYMKQAFINAAGMGLKVIVTAEYLVQTRDSLGKTIYTASYFNEYPDIYAYALIMIGLVALLTGVPRLLIRAAENRRKPVTSSQFPFR